MKILAVSQNVYSYREDNAYYIKSVPSHIYPEVRVPISKASSFVEELIEWKPDVIHSQCEFFSYGFARRIAKATNARIVHTYIIRYMNSIQNTFQLEKDLAGRLLENG